MRIRRPVPVQARLRQCTGRSLVLLKGRAARAGAALPHEGAGRRFATPPDSDAARASTDRGEALFFERLGAALFYGDPDLHDADLH
jgi:hypothetical protein